MLIVVLCLADQHQILSPQVLQYSDVSYEKDRSGYRVRSHILRFLYSFRYFPLKVKCSSFIWWWSMFADFPHSVFSFIFWVWIVDTHRKNENLIFLPIPSDFVLRILPYKVDSSPAYLAIPLGNWHGEDAHRL